MRIQQMFLTPSKYNRPQKQIKPTAIAWHYVGNPNTTAIANRNYFESLKDIKFNSENKPIYASSHFIIGLDGEILQLIPENEISYCTNKANFYTISIECCHPDNTGKFNEKTYISMIWLGKYLMKKYNIKENIRHYDVTGKKCPKWFVDNPNEWKIFKKKLEGNSMIDELVEMYGENNVRNALERIIKQEKNKENISNWARGIFIKSTQKNEIGKSIIQGDTNGNINWQTAINLERLMTILDRIGLLEEWHNAK